MPSHDRSDSDIEPVRMVDEFLKERRRAAQFTSSPPVTSSTVSSLSAISEEQVRIEPTTTMTQSIELARGTSDEDVCRMSVVDPSYLREASTPLRSQWYSATEEKENENRSPRGQNASRRSRAPLKPVGINSPAPNLYHSAKRQKMQDPKIVGDRASYTKPAPAPYRQAESKPSKKHTATFEMNGSEFSLAARSRFEYPKPKPSFDIKEEHQIFNGLYKTREAIKELRLQQEKDRATIRKLEKENQELKSLQPRETQKESARAPAFARGDKTTRLHSKSKPEMTDVTTNTMREDKLAGVKMRQKRRFQAEFDDLCSSMEAIQLQYDSYAAARRETRHVLTSLWAKVETVEQRYDSLHSRFANLETDNAKLKAYDMTQEIRWVQPELLCAL